MLLTTDFSPPATQLLDCLDEFKPLGLEEVVLVHVIDGRSMVSTEIALLSNYKEILEKNKAQLESMGFKIKIMTPIGIPTRNILKVAQEEQVAMIVIASHGQGIIEGILLGSTTNDLIRTSTIPVLLKPAHDADQETVSRMGKKLFGRVLLPIDFSLYSDRLLHQLLDRSPVFTDIVLLTVIENAHDNEELLRRIKESKRRLGEYQKEMEQQGLKVKTIVLDGAASTKIIDVAEREDITLIIMATLGEGLIKELLLGTTAHAVARRSQRPLLLMTSLRP